MSNCASILAISWSLQSHLVKEQYLGSQASLVDKICSQTLFSDFAKNPT